MTILKESRLRKEFNASKSLAHHDLHDPATDRSVVRKRAFNHHTYARLLAPLTSESAVTSEVTSEVTSKLRLPTGACRARVLQHKSKQTRILPAPLDADLQSRLNLVLSYLHPTAKRVLLRTHGVWPVEHLEGASAVFIPCDLDVERGRGGFILVDIGAFPLDREIRDRDIPSLYWRTLAGATGGDAPSRADPIFDPTQPTPTDHALRYLLLHELGHALSLYAGEFDLDERGKIRITHTDGFTGLSWKLITTEGKLMQSAPDDGLVQSVIPKVALDTVQWGSVLSVIDDETALLAPGYHLEQRQDPMTRTLYVCAAAANLPVAGFVTPTAARYPTEDYAEMFAHAILADEGKIHPSSRVPVDLPLCKVESLASPYFSPGVEAKRLYMERALGIRPRR